MSGTILIFSGPSGVGKDTIIDIWCKANPRVERIVAYTTRDCNAEKEVDGVDYHFVSQDVFDEMIAQDKFVEFKRYIGKSYGTPRDHMERVLSEGRIALLKIEVQGAQEVMAKHPEAKSVFLLPPSWEELERRIKERNRDSEEAMLKRLARAKEELTFAPLYQHQLVNETGKADELVKMLDQVFGKE